MALKGKIYSIAKQHDDLDTNELFQSMIDKSASQDTIVMDGRNIAAGSIFAEQIHAGAITAEKIRTDAITADHITAGVITGDKITSGVIRSQDDSMEIDLNNGTINLTKPLVIGSKKVATEEFVETNLADTVRDIEIGGRNLIVLSKLIVGRYLNNSTGALGTANAHAVTDFVVARPLTEYIFSGASGVQQVRFVSYDVNKNYISGVLYSGYRGGSQVYKTPENTEYIRISADFTSRTHYNNWVLEKGNKETDWTPAPEDVEVAYKAVAEAKANLAETQAKAHADGKVTAEEERAIADAEKKLKEAITHANKSIDDLEVGGVNLLVQSTITRGRYFRSDGATTSDAQWFHTDFIPVKGVKHLTTSGYSNLGSSPSVTYYNSSKTFVKGINNAGQSKAKLITIDSGIEFVRFSGMIKDLPTLKIEQGKKSTSWSPSPKDVEKAYTDVAEAKANLAKTQAEAYADGEITKEEKRAIQEAKDKLAEAKKHAEDKAGAAETNAKDYAKKQVDDLEVGGRNHLRNTGIGNSESISMFGVPMVGGRCTISTGTEYYILESTTSSGEAYYRATAQGTVPSEFSGTWTFSGEVLIPEGTSGVPLTRTQVAIGEPIAWVDSYGNGERPINATKGIWTKFVHTFEMPEGTQSLHLGIKFANNTQVSGDKIHFKNFKLERGKIATDWSPAPEDVQAEIDSRPTFGDFDRTDKVTINGGNIKAGTISSKNNYSRISLEDGSFNFGNGKFVLDGSTMTVNADNINLSGKVTFSDFNPALQGTVNSKVTQSDVNSSISNLEVGGTNLLLETSNEVSQFSITLFGESFSVSENYLPELLEGGKYTVSVYLPRVTQASGGLAIALTLGYVHGGVHKRYLSDYVYAGFKGLLTATFDVEKVAVSGVVNASVSLYANHKRSIGTYKQMKLERGTKATDWDAAPEDIYNDLKTNDRVVIHGGNIEAKTLSASKINATSLSAITANLGTVTAGMLRNTDSSTYFNLNKGEIVSRGTIVVDENGSKTNITSELKIEKGLIYSEDSTSSTNRLEEYRSYLSPKGFKSWNLNTYTTNAYPHYEKEVQDSSSGNFFHDRIRVFETHIRPGPTEQNRFLNYNFSDGLVLSNTKTTSPSLTVERGTTKLNGKVETLDLEVNGLASFPGGIQSQRLPSGTNIDSVRKTGFYYNPANNQAATMANRADSQAFSLLVEQDAGYKQTWTRYGTSGTHIWVRHYYNAVWGAWNKIV